MTSRLEHCLHDYKSDVFMFSLSKKSMVALWNIFQCWTSGHEIPDQDMIAFKKRTSRIDVDIPSKSASGFMSICYHYKGIEMINLPRILNSRYVRDAVPQVINNRTPPIAINIQKR